MSILGKEALWTVATKYINFYVSVFCCTLWYDVGSYSIWMKEQQLEGKWGRKTRAVKAERSNHDDDDAMLIHFLIFNIYFVLLFWYLLYNVSEDPNTVLNTIAH